MIHDVFHVSLLEQDITKRGQVDKTISQIKLDKDNNEEYEVEAIHNSEVNAKESNSGHL